MTTNLASLESTLADRGGGRVNYYLCHVSHPRRNEQPAYQAECEDLIASLGMTFDEGCEFKAIWRTAAARKGRGKLGQSAVYDAEKRVHYATRSLETELNKERDFLTLEGKAE